MLYLRILRDFIAVPALRVVLALAVLTGALIVCDWLFPVPMDRLHDLSVTVTDRTGMPLCMFTNGSGTWRLPATFGEVDPLYASLLLAYEDRRFFSHGGVDVRAVLRAVGQNLRAGHVVSGASTLTMQVARLLEPHRRSVLGKFLEMLRAMQLERHYSKEAILEMYWTLAPFGGSVEGARAAAWTYFGKSPRGISPPEAALLVALPQAPGRLRPDRAPERARSARDKVLDRAVSEGTLSARLAMEAKAEPIPTHLHPFPRHAYHLAAWLRKRHPGATTLASTVDPALQYPIEDFARRVRMGLVEHGSLALLLVENKEGRVVAYLGGPDFLDEHRNGWIDMVQAFRSPGSTLKPFVYGMGFEDRVIHPETLVADVSTRFGDYAPSNFDRGFHGEMTIREALQQSLNVPAVLVLDRIGPVRFTERLRGVGIRMRFPAGCADPGLPVALGGVSMNLWDLTRLYLSLSAAHGGAVLPLRMEPTPLDEATPPARLLSMGAAATVRRILQGTPPPPGLVPAGEGSRRPSIAFKTGTSYGFRDAWAFGVSADHTVGVWVGRPDGTPSPDHYGRNTAAPLLYQVFDRLAEDRTTEVSEPAEGAPPPLLRRIKAGDSDRQPLTLPDPDPVRFVFPTEGIVLEREEDDRTPLIFTAAGGRRPLTWVINGRPLTVTETKRETTWVPEGPGFSRMTVIDAEGRSASVRFQVK